MRKRIIFAAVSVLALVFASVAYAQNQGTAGNTTTSISAGGVKSKGGTKSKPTQQTKLNLTINSKTVNGQGQPATSTAIKSTLPKGWSFNTKKWPKSQQCNATLANQRQSASVCPKGSKVGGGNTAVKALGGQINRNLKLTAYVLTGGKLGTFVETAPGEAPAVKRMLVGSISGGVWNVKIDSVVQEPVPGIPTGISLLNFKFNGKTTVGKGSKKKTLGIAQSTACSGGKWTITVQNTYRDGKGKAATDTLNCRK